MPILKVLCEFIVLAIFVHNKTKNLGDALLKNVPDKFHTFLTKKFTTNAIFICKFLFGDWVTISKLGYRSVQRSKDSIWF
jgi:hypothetical protein